MSGLHRVVPFAVEVVAVIGRASTSFVGVLDAGGVLVGVQEQWTVRPVAVVVAPIRSTIIWWLFSGRPRQFMVIWENSRCSILFHLLVPGGRWQTVIAQTGFGGELTASSIFQARTREPLEPPPSAQISSLSACG